jgi:hypothetical protein
MMDKFSPQVSPQNYSKKSGITNKAKDQHCNARFRMAKIPLRKWKAGDRYNRSEVRKSRGKKNSRGRTVACNRLMGGVCMVATILVVMYSNSILEHTNQLAYRLTHVDFVRRFSGSSQNNLDATPCSEECKSLFAQYDVEEGDSAQLANKLCSMWCAYAVPASSISSNPFEGKEREYGQAGLNKYEYVVASF